MEIKLEIDPITQAVVEAQEWLCIAMEAQHWEEQLELWMEKGWESQMREGDTMVVSDKESVVEVAQQAVVEIGKKCCRVSLRFSLAILGS